MRLFAPILLTLLLATVAGDAHADGTVQAPTIQAPQADYVDLLNTYYAFGCATGSMIGVGTGFAVFSGGSALAVSTLVAGCAIGLLAGPIGMFVHDATTGDNVVERYVRENWYRSAAR